LVYISKVIVKGFKSFPQKQVWVAFEKGLNVITGPNGSGKSNIIDAIRFAMGENSAKSLRSNTLTGLIFDPGGGATLPARVSVTFENDDRAIAVDESRVTIVRELKPNGESSYYLNGRRVSRSTLMELLGAAHITPEGLNVVPQGAISRLAELHPNERRQMIEAAIGLKHFDEKKAEAMERLREADNQLAVSFAKLDERRASIERLEIERNDALRYKQLDYEIRRLRKAVALRKANELDRQLESLEQRAKELAGQEERERAKVVHLQASLKAVEEERDAYYGENVSVPNKQMIDLGLEIGKIDTQLTGLADRKQRYESSLSTLKDTALRLEGMLREIQKEMAEVRDEAEGLQAELRRLDEEGRAEAQRKKELLVRREKIRRRVEDVTVRDLRLWERKEMVEAKVVEAQAKLDELREELAKALSAKDELERKHQEMEGLVRSMKQQLEAVAVDREEDRSRIRALDERISIARRQQEKLSAEVKLAEGILANATQTILKYESGKEVAEKYLTEELNARKVDELARSGVVDGYRGMLHEMISYEKQYSSAVKAAGGDWLSAMVVDDMNGLLQLAALTKRLRSSRIRILPLSELKGTPVTKVPYDREILGRLSDFVKSSDLFEPAVNFVFGDVLLAASAKAAYVFSKRGYRAVTLHGDLFEAGGTAMETGRASELTLEELGISDPEQLKYVEESLKAFKISIERQKKGLERLTQALAAYEKEKFKLALRLENEDSRLNTLVPMVKRYVKLERVMARRLRAQTAAIGVLQRRIARLSVLLARLRTKGAKLAERRAELGLLALKFQEEELDGLLASLSKAEDESAKAVLNVNARLSTLQARLNGELEPKARQIGDALERTVADLKEAELGLPTIRAQMEELQARRQELAEREAKVRADAERALPRLKELEMSSKSLRDEISAVEQRILRIEREKLRVESNAQGIRGEKVANQRAIEELGVDEEVDYTVETEAVLALYVQEQAALKDQVNLLADQSYREAFTSYREASRRRNELEKDRNAIVKFIEEVESEKRATFMLAYEKVDRELRGIFAKLTDGAAWMELENPADPFSGGLFLVTQFPTKAARESSSTSGGEKAIVAVSFLLAFQAAYPSPFYLLDEIDAHLDAVYTQRLGRLMAEWSSQAQIVMVSLKEAVVSHAHNLIGVYGVNGVSNAVRFKSKAEVTVSV